MSGDGGPPRNSGISGHRQIDPADQWCRIEHDFKPSVDIATEIGVAVAAHCPHLLAPRPPLWAIDDAVGAVAPSAVMLLAHLLTGAPDPDRLLGLRRPGIAAVGHGGEKHAAAPLLGFDVGAKRLLQALFVTPNAVGHVSGLKRVRGTAEQHLQGAEPTVITRRVVGHLGHAITVGAAGAK